MTCRLVCFLRRVKVTRTLPFISTFHEPDNNIRLCSAKRGKRTKVSCLSKHAYVIKQQPSCVCPLQAIFISRYSVLALNTSLFGRRPTGMWCHVPKLPDSQMTISAVFLRKMQIHRTNDSISSLNNKAALPWTFLLKKS